MSVSVDIVNRCVMYLERENNKLHNKITVKKQQKK